MNVKNEVEGISLASLSHINKLVRIICIIIVVLLVAGAIFVCAIGLRWDYIYRTRASIKTPYEYPGTVWRSDNPFIELTVGNESRDTKDAICYLERNGELLEVVFSPGLYPQLATFTVEEREGNDVISTEVLIRCKAKYTETEITLTVVDDYCFNGEYKTIVLHRQINNP